MWLIIDIYKKKKTRNKEREKVIVIHLNSGPLNVTTLASFSHHCNLVSLFALRAEAHTYTHKHNVVFFRGCVICSKSYS